MGDKFHSLKEAKDSGDWPEWRKVIEAKLGQLCEKKTWELVEKPKDAILLANKWVFVWKCDKEGRILKYKARLVAKGYLQWPGYDYVETHSPIICLESIRTLLVIVITKCFSIQQMDVKGAYLNGILKETVYMQQPKGFTDGSK